MNETREDKVSILKIKKEGKMKFKIALAAMTMVVCSLLFIGNCLAEESKGNSEWVTIAEPEFVDIIDHPPHWEMAITDKFKEINFTEFSNYEFRLINESNWNTVELFPYQIWIRKGREVLMLYFYTSFIGKKPGQYIVEKDPVSAVYTLNKNISLVTVSDYYLIGKIQARRID